MLPEVVEMLGGKSFDMNNELLVSGVIVVGCFFFLLYAHIFLDDNLRPKKEPLAFIPRALGWTKDLGKVRKKE